MNLQYETKLPYAPPVQSRAGALSALAAFPAHKQFGSTYGDLARAYATENIGNYNLAADQANFGYNAQRLATQQNLALQGLQNMATEQHRLRQLGTARLQDMRGALGALL